MGALALALLDRPAQARPRARARQVICLTMAGGPSQLDLFTPKPKLQASDGQPLPPSFTKGQRFAFIKGTPRLLGSPFAFRRHGQAGAWLSDLLPHLARVVDKLSFLHAVSTPQINHGPAQLFLCTGHPQPGRPGMGAWLAYGLGSSNQDLPAFVVLLSGERQPDGGKALWGSGFLPGAHQGVELRPQGDPVFYLSNPPGIDRAARRDSLDTLARLDRLQAARRRSRQPHPRLRAGVPDASGGARAGRSRSGAAGHPRALRHHPRAAVVRQQLPAGPAADRTGLPGGAAVSPGLGQPRRQPQRRSGAPAARPVPRDRPRDRGVAAGSGSARAAGFDAGAVGGRVRAHAHGRGARRLAFPRAGPPRAGVHGLAGRRRHPPRGLASAPATISVTTRPRAR